MWQVPFNGLPRAGRERFVAITHGQTVPRPLFFERVSTAGEVFGWICLALLGVLLFLLVTAVGYGQVSSPEQGWRFVPFYVGGALLAGYSLLRAIRRARFRRTLPYVPGRYLFPLHIVDARTERLRILPLSAATKLDCMHWHRNGLYTHTKISFLFPREIVTFHVHGREAAQAIVDQVHASSAYARQAHERGDNKALWSIDPFFDLQTQPAMADRAAEVAPGDGPATRRPPFVLARAALLAAAVALVAGPIVQLARNHASEQSRIAELRAHPDPYLCRAYLDRGGRHEAEVRDVLLPRAEYEEARDDRSVAALRSFLSEHPQSRYAPDARRDIARMYDDALAAFVGQASTEDPRTVPFMTSLLDWLEAHDTPRLQVRFLPPSAETLALADRVLAERRAPSARPIIPIAPHFTDERNREREGEIAQRLQEGFGRVFSNDVLRVDDGERLTPGEIDAPITEPRIQVSYAVVPSGVLYDEEGGTRSFVGIRVVFDVRMRIPGDPQGLDFRLDVEPPERITYQATAGEDEIYSVMAERAFAQLSDRLTAVFFRRPAEPEARL